MKLFKKTVEKVSPIASSIACVYCKEHGTNEQVEELLKVHYKTCRNTLGFRIEIENSLKNGGPVYVSSLSLAHLLLLLF